MRESEPTWDDGLSAKERLFVLHYCTNDHTFLNATQSYRETYLQTDRETGKTRKLPQKSCEAASSRLMKKPEVKLAITRLLKMTQADIDEEGTYRLLHDLMLYATYNPADIINSDGTLKKDLRKLGELAKCVTEIIPTKYGMRIRLADRTKYMSQLLQYLNIIRPEIQIDAQLPVIEMVQKAINADTWNEIAAQNE